MVKFNTYLPNNPAIPTWEYEIPSQRNLCTVSTGVHGRMFIILLFALTGEGLGTICVPIIGTLWALHDLQGAHELRDLIKSILFI